MKSNKFVVLFTVLVSFLTLAIATAVNKVPNGNNIVTLSEGNTVILSGEVDGDNVGKVISAAKEIDRNTHTLKKRLGLSKQDPIYLFMDTPGGSIQSGMELTEALKGLDRPVSTITLFSASMGFQLVQSLGERLILNSGVLMSHKASGKFSGSFGGQKPSQLENRYALWYQRMQEFDQQTVNRSNGKQTMESYQKAYDQELWLTGQQSIDGGYADKIVTVKCDATLSGVTTHTVSFLGLQISYDLDKCPINTSPMNVKVSAPDERITLSDEKVEDIKSRFMEQYTSKLRKVIYSYW